MSLRLAICGQRKYAKANLCIVDRDDFILLVQENKTQRVSAPGLPAQLIAQAIAAFNKNNRNRLRLGLAPRASAIIPGITLKGQTFTFFKVPVTAALVTAVNAGTFLMEETVVSYHDPTSRGPGPCGT